MHMHALVSTAHETAARVMAADCLCFRARRVSRVVTRVYDDALRPLGLQATQLTLLNAITMSDRGDGASMRRVADLMSMDQTTLSRNVRLLARAGLVRIATRATDRRTRVLTLTASGRRRQSEALPLWRGAHARLTAALGAGGAAMLRESLDATFTAAAPPADLG